MTLRILCIWIFSISSIGVCIVGILRLLSQKKEVCAGPALLVNESRMIPLAEGQNYITSSFFENAVRIFAWHFKSPFRLNFRLKNRELVLTVLKGNVEVTEKHGDRAAIIPKQRQYTLTSNSRVTIFGRNGRRIKLRTIENGGEMHVDYES